MITIEKIEERKKALLTQREQAVSAQQQAITVIHMVDGAIQILDALLEDAAALSTPASGQLSAETADAVGVG